MKKKVVTFLTSLALMIAALAVLCACSTYGSIKSAFKKEGYTETELSSTYESAVTEIMGSDYKNTVTVHCLSKQADENAGVLDQLVSAAGYVVIIEFKSDSDMAEYLKGEVSADEADDAKAIYDKLQTLKTVNGNCFLVVSTLPEGYTIFQNTK